MTRLCFGTYFSILSYCKNNTCTKKELVSSTMHSLSNDFNEEDNSLISKIIHGRKNPPKFIIEIGKDFLEDRYIDLIDYFKCEVIKLIDQNKMALMKEALLEVIESDKVIKNDCVVNIITQSTKSQIREKSEDIPTFLAGIFLYVIKYTDNENKYNDVNSLDKIYRKATTSLKPVKKSESTKRQPVSKRIAEETYREVQRFCIKHEKELDLLPLCQIASSINPMHEYVRTMYTDYCLCSKAVKNQILKHNGQLILDFSDDGWVNRCIEIYDKRILESNLCSQSFLYEGAKYLHRAFSRHFALHADYDPYVFKDIRANKNEKFNTKSNLTGLIYNYLWIKDKTPEVQIESPIDILWDHCRNIHEEDVTFWVCQIIISSCSYIEKPGEWGNETDIRNISIGDGITLINSQEDMYLCALLELYKYYYNWKE